MSRCPENPIAIFIQKCLSSIHPPPRSISRTHALILSRAIPITFVLPDGEEVEVKANHGETVLDVAIENDIDIEGG